MIQIHPRNQPHVVTASHLVSRVSNKPYFVYVLWSASTHKFYIGIAEAPAERLVQHNSGDLASWTKRHRPWSLVLAEQYENYSDARKRGIELKSQKASVVQIHLATNLSRDSNPPRNQPYVVSPVKAIEFHTSITSKFYGDDYAVKA